MEIEKGSFLQSPLLITQAIYLFLLPYFCYAGEMQDRKIFSSLDKLQIGQKCYEHLIKNVLPCFIVILQMGKISFFNRKTKEMFQIDDEIGLIEILKHVKVRKT